QAASLRGQMPAQHRLRGKLAAHADRQALEATLARPLLAEDIGTDLANAGSSAAKAGSVTSAGAIQLVHICAPHFSNRSGCDLYDLVKRKHCGNQAPMLALQLRAMRFGGEIHGKEDCWTAGRSRRTRHAGGRASLPDSEPIGRAESQFLRRF